jgi:predicted Zn-dependent protease
LPASRGTSSLQLGAILTVVHRSGPSAAILIGTLALLAPGCGLAAAAPPVRPPAAPADAVYPPLIETLNRELTRNFEILKKKADPAPYFLSYQVTDAETSSLSASWGAITNRGDNRRRALDVSIRVGSRQLDNYHFLEGDRPRFAAASPLPGEDHPLAIAQAAWRDTDRAWRAAAARYLKIKTTLQVKSASKGIEEFSTEKPAQSSKPVPRPKWNADEWAARLRKLSLEVESAPGLLGSEIGLVVRREVHTLVTSEGTRVEHGRTFARIQITIRGKAYDGQDLVTSDSFEADEPAGLPKDDVIAASVRNCTSQIRQLLRAQPADPFVGPAILSERAAGVFFHEIFGHRVEGHRLRDETEGHTFSASIDKPVLPPFLNVTFDPTRRAVGKISLFGWYDFDDEGVPAQPVEVVEKGTLKTFLMSRTPVAGIGKSNGHGRTQPGMEVVSRQSNLLVSSSRQVSMAKLKELLLEEVRKQNKPYGLYFDQVTGGYTTTRRGGLQAYTVIPLVVYRIYPNGQQELVRGADIVGTPLSSFSRILATSDTTGVFNGYCGAESGNVPVSAVSPALLVSEIEIQRKPESRDLQPLVPRPTQLEGGQR